MFPQQHLINIVLVFSSCIEHQIDTNNSNQNSSTDSYSNAPKQHNNAQQYLLNAYPKPVFQLCITTTTIGSLGNMFNNIFKH